MNINVEYINAEKHFPVFEEHIKGKKLSVICDMNTEKYADRIIADINGCAREIKKICFYEDELVPDEHVYGRTIDESRGCDYILAVGSGSLNDTAKYASREIGAVSGVFATAASMDGYASNGAPMMENGFKVTENCASPRDILIDTDVICAAPRILTASGFGDIAGKYTCLADWKLANIIKNEEINTEAYTLMEKALSDCMDVYDGLTRYEDDAVKKLMNALITAGKAMAICIAFLGVGVVAIPTGIISAGFVEQYTKKEHADTKFHDIESVGEIMIDEGNELIGMNVEEIFDEYAIQILLIIRKDMTIIATPSLHILQHDILVISSDKLIKKKPKKNSRGR